MKWFCKRIPNLGETRILERFIWLPISLPYQGRCQFRWLERSKIKQVAELAAYPADESLKYVKFNDKEWV